MNTSKWESQPSISADGKTLYFVSNRANGLGKSDIWVTHLAPNNEWTVPRNLGDVINTPHSEETPFIHPDGKTLYFTSDGHVGMGGKDIFMTKMQPDGTWSTPKNLGYPINTWNDEQGLFVAASGENAYFSSDRDGGFGKLDIYSFPLYEEARKRLSKYPNSKIIRKKSLEAAEDFDDESLDFVFIDADHRFRQFTDDLDTWTSKVRKGGIICGHLGLLLGIEILVGLL